MLLAAGLGTRLGPLTQKTPKALIPLGGVPILERVARRLIEAGVDRLIINTHHHADQVVDFVESRKGFGVEVAFSHEADEPLETGGGLRYAAPLFRCAEPFFVHNSDILSEIPLEKMYSQHLERSPLATLAVMNRETTRRLLWDDDGLLGRVDDRKGVRLECRDPVGPVRGLGFAGIHVISPEFLTMMEEEGVFSILDPYLRLAAEGRRIEPFEVDSYQWIDVGKPEQLEAARTWLETS